MTRTKPRNNLKSKPPHKVTKKNVSDLFNPIFISINPIVKFSTDSTVPNKIDFNNNPDILLLKKSTKRIAIENNETSRLKIIRDFSFLIISGFLNRFDKSIQASKHSQKSKNYCQNRFSI